ncbi:MAG: hypothetical protein WBA16_12445 [Nonlabens sp.]
MKLSTEQIDELFAFTKKHYVEHYDLQLELVDHLSNGIEQQWAVDPQLTFKDALAAEFKKFGVFGFMDVVEARRKAMTRRYSKIIFQHMKKWFKLPQILLVVVATAAFYSLFQIKTFGKEVVALTAGVILISWLVGLVLEFRRRKRNKKEKNNNTRIWMLEEMIGGLGSAYGIFMMPYYIMQPFIINDYDPSGRHPAVLVGVSFILALIIILYYVVYVEIPKKAREYLDEVYPEYRLIEKA